MLKKLATMLANILAKKKQYCVQNNMLNVKNNTAATSLLNFNDQSLAKKKKDPEDFQYHFSHTLLA